MCEDFVLLSTLNDFIFCPYSIYLHNIYMETDEGLYHATPQTQGRIAHEAIDSKKSSTRKNDILALPVFSSRLGIMGKIDTYRKNDVPVVNIGTFGRDGHMLTERVDMVQTFQNVPNISYETICRLLK